MSIQQIEAELFRLQDRSYRDLQAKIVPNVAPERLIGVRLPALRAYAKALGQGPEAEAFLRALPHPYYDEDQLHALLLSQMKDFDRCLAAVDRFLPYVDNWATCDTLIPACFKKHRRELVGCIERWLDSEETYTVRFGVGMLMRHYLDEDFDPACLKRVAQLRSEAYYVNMMRAWYFATALAKQYEAALPYLEGGALDPWTHTKAIQKAVESYRVPAARKEYLKGLRIRSR